MEFAKNAKILLDTWMGINRSFKKSRNLEDMNFNEILVCGILVRKKETGEVDPKIQVKELSDIMKISRPAVNNIINKLEDKGYIERTRNKGDRKSVYIKLTKKAFDIYASEQEKIVIIMNSIVEKLGNEETEKLIELLGKLQNVIGKEDNKLC